MGLTPISLNDGEIKKLVNDGLSIREIANRINGSYTGVKYRLRRLRIKTRFVHNSSITHKCGCGATDPKEFYGHKKSQCVKCYNRYRVALMDEKRQYAVSLLGGKCRSCGFNKHISALSVHHKDPTKKDLMFRSYRSWSHSRIAEEMKTCVLLCNNCHSAFHAGEIESTGW
jgi:DNA-binding CsgD family transcriptional regulator